MSGTPQAAVCYKIASSLRCVTGLTAALRCVDLPDCLRRAAVRNMPAATPAAVCGKAVAVADLLLGMLALVRPRLPPQSLVRDCNLL